MPAMSGPDSKDFDRLSAAAAAAWAAGDERRARRLADEATALHLLPRFRRLSHVRGHVRELREDVLAHALLRVVIDWRKGKAVTWATLERIFVNAAVDVKARDQKVPRADLAFDDEDAREAFYSSQSAAPAGESEIDLTLDRVELEQLADEFERLRRPRWAAYVRAWQQGYRSGPDVEHATGIRAGRARQIRMDVCQYLRAYQPALARKFGCEGSVEDGGTP